MRILFVGDVMGSLGRDMITQYLPQLKKKYHPQVTIVNGENAASGRGITEKIYKKLLQDGADLITMGNHTWDNRDIFNFIGQAKQMVRPANFPEGTPGVGMKVLKINALKLAVINLQGRTFMPPLDDPFKKALELVTLAQKETPLIFVDFHAETTANDIVTVLATEPLTDNECWNVYAPGEWRLWRDGEMIAQGYSD